VLALFFREYGRENVVENRVLLVLALEQVAQRVFTRTRRELSGAVRVVDAQQRREDLLPRKVGCLGLDRVRRRLAGAQICVTYELSLIT